MSAPGPHARANIVLVALNRNTIYTPLASLYLQACIQQDKALSRRVDVEIREFESADSVDYILWEILKPKPKVVGFSCYLWNIGTVLALCRMIRQVMPETVTVLGGPEVSSRGREVLAGNPAVDVVVRGEGEFVFTRVIRAILNGGGFRGIGGISWRKGSKVVENAGQGFVRDIDAVPPVYSEAHKELANREVCLETQRGCVFGCWFCYYNKGCRGWRKFGMGRVKRELAFLLSQKDLTVYLMDPVFNLDLKRAKDICRFIIARNRHRVPFHTELQAELVDGELAALLKKAGMRYVEVGLQSSDEDVLSAVGRTFNRGRFIRGFNHLKSNGLVVELQLILGLPGDSLESFERSLDFALELDPAVLSVFKLQVLPGTRVREHARSLGIEYNHEPPYEFIRSRRMSFRDAMLAQKIVNSVSLFRKDRRAREFCRRRGIPMTRLIRSWLEYMPSDAVLLNGEDNRALAKEAGRFVRSLA